MLLADQEQTIGKAFVVDEIELWLKYYFPLLVNDGPFLAFDHNDSQIFRKVISAFKLEWNDRLPGFFDISPPIFNLLPPPTLEKTCRNHQIAAK